MGWAARANPRAQDAKAGRIAPRRRTPSEKVVRDRLRLTTPPLAAILAALGLKQ
jgi:hypothetical protein